MEEESRKHFQGIRILVTLALLAAFISFAFTYILFKEVSVPLDRLRNQELNQLQSQVDYLISSRLNGRMEVELQMAIINMKELEQTGSDEVKALAGKAASETQALLDAIRGAQAE